jgi:spore coat protein JB
LEEKYIHSGDAANIKSMTANLSAGEIKMPEPPRAKPPEYTSNPANPAKDADWIKPPPAALTGNPENTENGGGCGYKSGEAPDCPPLAAGFVPFQRMNPPRYDAAEALTRGTLFPGLDLPFMNAANRGNPYAGTPLGDLMAIDFTLHELVLYLDTHGGDREAFELLRNLTALKKEGRERYVRLYGPLDTAELASQERFNWTHGPWPWEYKEVTGK